MNQLAMNDFNNFLVGFDRLQDMFIHGNSRSDLWIRKGLSFIAGKGGQEPMITDRKGYLCPLKDLVKKDTL